MEFNDFRDDIYSKWQNRILKLCWVGTVLIFIFELIVFFAFLKTDFLTTTVLHYLSVRVLLPSGINFASAVLCVLGLRSNRFTVSEKNYVACIAIFIISSVVTIFHNYYKFLLVANGLPIVICSIFVDKKLLRHILELCLATFVVSAIVMWFDDFRLGTVDFITTLICALMFIFILYAIAKTIVVYQNEQINFIYSASQRQSQLIYELKIEPLTKLYNRTALDGALKSFVRKYNQKIINPHLVLLDLDHFKQVNDTWGHANGDMVLIRFAEIIKENMGGIRRAFRYGGEEFVLLFENESTGEVHECIEKIRIQLCAEQFQFAPGENFTLSAGISKLRDGWDDTTWFNDADTAMYRAKEGGRNRIELGEPD